MKTPNITHLNNKKRNIEGYSVFQFEGLFNKLVNGVCIVDEAGRIEYVNPAYEVMFGVSIFTVKGKSVYRVTNDDLLLTAFKTKTQLKGYLSSPMLSNRICGSAAPIFIDREFRGVIGLYYSDSSKAIADKSIIKINKVQQDKTPLSMPFSSHEIIGGSRSLREALRLAEKASRTASTVLIKGESGTGKELVARAIHDAGYTKDKPFVKVNCTAIPATLLESELFGHEQGAFTGAVKRKTGKFEHANGGTIFLDEIGDMPIDMQVKLLRVLQEKEFERVGGNETIKCNVRIISATHRNLEEQIQKELFREDLYYRLNVIPIQLPSLNERREDIAILCQHFIDSLHRKKGLPMKVLSDDVKELLYNYDWPGNIRELENLIERLVVLSEGDTITIDDLPSNISCSYKANLSEQACTTLINMTQEGGVATLEAYEREIIQAALEQFGSFNATAKALGITHKTVAFKARKYGLLK